MYVFDPRWPGEFRPATTHSRQTRVIWFTVGQTSTISEIADQIRMQAGNLRSIWLLRLCAHGNAGSLQLGEGLDMQTAWMFAPLWGYFTPDGRGIEVHGCSVASAARVVGGQELPSVWNDRGAGAMHVADRVLSANSPHPQHVGTVRASGFAFLKALANATGACVTASYDIQRPDREFRWEGRGTMRVAPDY